LLFAIELRLLKILLKRGKITVQMMFDFEVFELRQIENSSKTLGR